MQTGDRVFIHGSAATPVVLVKALQSRHVELHQVELISITTMGDLNFDNPLWRESFFFNSLFVINSAIEVDLTGQVCADSMGTYQYSGIGGQMDFIRGASLSENGLPIIAMPSVTSTGISRIVPFLKEGAGVVTTRGHRRRLRGENV